MFFHYICKQKLSRRRLTNFASCRYVLRVSCAFPISDTPAAEAASCPHALLFRFEGWITDFELKISHFIGKTAHSSTTANEKPVPL